ncbi:MAG: type II toxin-antitoxin system RelE/ParE family toxin [Planctomycetes bacterium]|nr:type II toxin-antitoxin system RelE/ParE family toxin [Planctomycetota bacterium]
MNVRLLPEAEEDLVEAARWYRAARRELGSEFLRAAEARLEKLGRMPVAFPIVLRTVRRSTLRRFPYSFFYTVRNGELVVLACLHVSRYPEQWKRRM